MADRYNEELKTQRGTNKTVRKFHYDVVSFNKRLDGPELGRGQN